ncbi:hypothetical protein F3Y22_tig00013808pilonHSYRG00121 [Hibiscus syriacus]|uniref:Uncharacterized protein n=1 Tax=Hibiscus syriacus TaxID=106335 RepID=A0A6A3C1F5_HIBSY|nr:hypothetical protein F3Y22_tig00013808pilonHSYRG00121 [Hibiscus syriacus]
MMGSFGLLMGSFGSMLEVVIEGDSEDVEGGGDVVPLELCILAATDGLVLGVESIT